MRTGSPILAMIALLTFLTSATAAEYKRYILSDGTAIEYALVLPENYRKDQDYPAILAFPGGRQSIRGVGGTLERFWEREAVKRGFIVISPAAAEGKPFFGAGADLVPEFLRHILETLPVKGGKFIIAGHSNGAVSAFRIAVRHPNMYRSLIAIAGFSEFQEGFDQLQRIKALDVLIIVGDGDQYWKEGMERTKARLETFGARVRLKVVPRNGHFLPSLTYENSWKIFDQIKD